MAVRHDCRFVSPTEPVDRVKGGDLPIAIDVVVERQFLVLLDRTI